MVTRYICGLALVASVVLIFACSKSTAPDDNGSGGPTNPPSDSAGAQWTAVTLPNNLFAGGVAWGNGKFVAIGNPGGGVSVDGHTWNPISGVGGGPVRYGNGIFVAIASYIIWRSGDGVNWTISMPSDTPSTGVFFDYLLRQGADFGVSGEFYPGFGWSAWSTDGQYWSVSDSFSLDDVVKAIGEDPTHATGPVSLFRNGRVTSPGYDAHISPAASSLELNAVVYGTRWVIVADSGIVFTSSDAKNWSRTATPVTGTLKNLRDVVWTGSLFVAVGEYGTVLTSPTGLAWTQRDSRVTYRLRQVAWSGSHVVAVGDGGAIVSP